MLVCVPPSVIYVNSIALDRERCLEIIVAYGVRPRAERLLCHYWEGLTMVALSGRYYGTPFKGSRGVT